MAMREAAARRQAEERAEAEGRAEAALKMLRNSNNKNGTSNHS